MAEFTVQIERIYFHRDRKRGEDGSVYYLILSPCQECRRNPEHHCCATHPAMVHHYERQAFRRGSSGHRLDATPEEIAKDHANVWGWDGSKVAPTVTPSFLGLDVKDGRRIRPYRLHCYIRNGQIDLCGDSTVALHPNPTPCRDRPIARRKPTRTRARKKARRK